MNTLCFQIQPTAPFAFDLALSYLRTSPSSILEVITEDSYRRAIRINGKDVLVTVRAPSTPGPFSQGAGEGEWNARECVLPSPAAGRGGRGRGKPPPRSNDGHSPRVCSLGVELVGPDLGPEDQTAAETRVRRMFATDADVSALLDDVRGDPVFADLAGRCAGLRPVLIPDLFETVVWAIIGQQINVRFAAKCKRALVGLCGDRLHVNGQEYLVFPDPERMASLNEADLAAIQFSRQKTRYVLNLAREICEGRLVLDDLWQMSGEDALARLEGILGVGRWTAEYVLMRGLGHSDVIPAADGGLRRIIGRAYGLVRSASEAEVRQFAEGWGGWRSYAAFYWWFALQMEARGETFLPL